jgi:transposase
MASFGHAFRRYGGFLPQRDAAVTERDALLAQNGRLRHPLLQLRRMHFGARSERLPEEQLQLGLEALAY